MGYKTWDDVAKEQAIVARLLKNHILFNRLNHAYIFEGVKGTKKQDIALFYTKAIFCKNRDGDANPCLTCQDCLKVDRQTHANLFVIQPDGQMIKKEQIKDLIEEFSKSSLEDGPRMNIILQADRFNLSSANALLKTMEEPGEDIYQIMITENLDALLPTIKSRGEVIHFVELNRVMIRDYLQEQGIKASYTNPISQYTANIEEALDVANDDLSIELIDLIVDIFQSFVDEKQSTVITFLESSGKVVSSLSRTIFFLDFMILFQKDLIQTLLHQSSICYMNHKMLLEKLAKKTNLKQAELDLQEMLELSKRLKYNIHLPLAFNYLLAKLERGYKNGA